MVRHISMFEEDNKILNCLLEDEKLVHYLNLILEPQSEKHEEGEKLCC